MDTAPPEATSHATARASELDSIADGPAATTRVGVIVPHDMALDAELWRWTPADVSLHITREPYLSMPLSLEMTMQLGDNDVLADCARGLLAISPGSCAYACTSGSFSRGLAAEQSMVQAMTDTGIAHAFTTSGALLAALEALSVQRVAVGTPYDGAITERLGAYLAEAGVDVVGSSHLGLDADIWTVPYARTAELVRTADTPEADAIFLSCTNLPTYDLIAPLEKEIGKPVITANQVTMWQALRLVERRCVGAGQHLLEAA